MADAPTPVADGLVERWGLTLLWIVDKDQWAADMVADPEGDYVAYAAFEAQAREIAELRAHNAEMVDVIQQRGGNARAAEAVMDLHDKLAAAQRAALRLEQAMWDAAQGESL